MQWLDEAMIYHIYPLGLCGAPHQNDPNAPPQPRLKKIHGWLDHIQSLGATALLLGPVFASSTHGYDTSDYFQVDRRLGGNPDLQQLADDLRRRGLRLILDAVFHHVGRDFWAFCDVRQNLEQSRFCPWFQGLTFGAPNGFGEPFTYDTWEGHAELVKLNLRHPEVKDHLLAAVTSWVQDYGIDGLRLDAANCMDPAFLQDLAAWCRSLNPDFWLLGEAVHGDYRTWANPRLLDSVTNYEIYKGLYSSHNDRNYFEIAYSLNRQFGEHGLYRHLRMYNFADNHDVSRTAAVLQRNEHIYPLYCLLFCLPGIPSLYYGSEWGIEGRKSPQHDWDLRPALDLESAPALGRHRDLAEVIRRLAGIRRSSPALRHGGYRQVHVGQEQLVFMRTSQEESVLVAVNASDQTVDLNLRLEGEYCEPFTDMLNPGGTFVREQGRLTLVRLHPHWARIIRLPHRG